jgi:hypothetical protein
MGASFPPTPRTENLDSRPWQEVENASGYAAALRKEKGSLTSSQKAALDARL